MTNDQVIEYIKMYTEDILAFYEVNASVDVRVNEDMIDVSIPSTTINSLLIGRNAETLRALQYLLSTILRMKDTSLERVNLDIADYKKQRAEKIETQAREWIEEVRRSGDSYVASLNAADRRVVHQLATEYEDIQTFSEGEGRDRKLVIAQKSS